MRITNFDDGSGKIQTLGGRLPLLHPAGLSPEQTRLYGRIEADMVSWADKAGFQAKLDDERLIGPFNPILFSPAIGDAFLALQAAGQHHTSLNERMRQVVILTVGAVWRCDYERYAHAAVARKTGLSSGAIADLSRGELPNDLSPGEALVQRLAWQLAESRWIPSDLYA